MNEEANNSLNGIENFQLPESELLSKVKPREQRPFKSALRKLKSIYEESSEGGSD